MTDHPAVIAAPPARSWIADSHPLTGAELREHYQRHANDPTDSYADEVAAWDFRGHLVVARLALAAVDTFGAPRDALTVADLACGDGAVGRLLVAGGFDPIALTGVDWSPEMCRDAVRDGVYGTLHDEIDLTEPWSPALGRYSIVTCSGLLSAHGRRETVRTLIAATRVDGVVICSARRGWVRKVGFDTYLRSLVHEGLIRVEHREVAHYVRPTPGDDGLGIYYVLRRRLAPTTPPPPSPVAEPAEGRRRATRTRRDDQGRAIRPRS